MRGAVADVLRWIEGTRERKNDEREPERHGQRQAKRYSSKLTSSPSIVLALEITSDRQLSVHRIRQGKERKKRRTSPARVPFLSPLGWDPLHERDASVFVDDFKLVGRVLAMLWAGIPFDMVLAVEKEKIISSLEFEMKKRRTQAVPTERSLPLESKERKETKKKTMLTLHPAVFLAKTRPTQHSALTEDPLRRGST